MRGKRRALLYRATDMSGDDKPTMNSHPPPHATFQKRGDPIIFQQHVCHGKDASGSFIFELTPFIGMSREAEESSSKLEQSGMKNLMPLPCSLFR